MSGHHPGTFEERFWAKVRKTASCWVWFGAGSSTGLGYGHLYRDHHWVAAHRVAYELLVGPIPVGCVIDHLCRNPRCVNPKHLDPVKQRVNVIDRGQGPFAQRARQTHCLRGHEFTLENTYIHKSRGVRICRICHNENVKVTTPKRLAKETPERRTARLERERTYQREYQRAHPEKHREYKRRYEAKRNASETPEQKAARIEAKRVYLKAWKARRSAA